MTYQAHFQQLFSEQDNSFKEILGQTHAKEQLKSALLTDRHILIHGPPGIGKTTLAKNIAKCLPNNVFVRVQGSPDLTAEDLLGDIDPMKALEFGPLSPEAFQKGKIFKADGGIFFFDEVNRCSEKLQNALLQVLEEQVATIGAYDVDIPTNFLFVGTLNPQDSSTENLSDAFLDRFDVIEMQYPESQEIEEEIVRSKSTKLEVEFPQECLFHLVAFIRSLRNPNKLKKFPSVRASIGLFERAQANAILKKQSVVTLQDIHDAILSVLSHRIELKPSLKYSKSVDDFIKQEFVEYTNTHDLTIDKPGDST